MREKNQTATEQDHENFVAEGPLPSEELETLIANLKKIEPKQNVDGGSTIVDFSPRTTRDTHRREEAWRTRSALRQRRTVT